MTVKNVPPYISHFDGNQVPSIIGVEGTLGTTDQGGTARAMPVGVNPNTGAMYVQDLSGASGTTNVQIVGGTFNAGTATVNVATGTQQTLGTVGTVIGVGTISNIVTTSGTVTGVGVVSALTTGSVAVTVGTIVGPTASGGTPTTAPVLVGGTDSTGTVYAQKISSGGNLSVVPVSIPAGTLTNLANGTLAIVTTVSNLTNGSVNLLTGTVTSVTSVANIVAGTLLNSGTTTGVGVVSSLSELVKGTVTNLVSGTINALASGTITAGTVRLNATPAGSTIISTHVLGTAGGTTLGTLLASAGAGTFVYLAGLSIVARSGTPDVAIMDNVAGSTGAGVFARGQFAPGGGIARDFNPVLSTVAAGTLAYMVINGTADLTVNYWVSP